ncbi:MAG: tripartite tricarboxylate transporter substrate-binding protein [Rhodospirillales bacterium]
MNMKIKSLAALSAVALTAGMTTPSSAESPAEFYKGKTVTMLVGAAPGGGYATYASLLARHIGRHIPGKPTVIAKNMPGAGSLKALTLLYNRSAKDGTVFGAIYKGALIEPLVGTRGVEYETMKLNFVGSVSTVPKVCFAWHTTGITKFEDLMKKQMITGGSGATSSIFQYATMVRNMLGAKLKVIGGYKGSAASLLALERGEVTGMCGLGSSSLMTQRAHWIKEKKITILAQIAHKPDPDLVKMGVPEIWKFVKDEDVKKAMQLIVYPPDRPYVLPPGVPADRVAAMQKAFMDTMSDPKFLAEAKKARVEINPTSGPEMREILADIYKSSPKIVELAKAALSRKGTIKCKEITDPKYCRGKKKKKKKKKESS